MMYRLIANIEYKNGDFERRILDDFIHQEDGEDALKIRKSHWDINKDQYEKVKGLTFELVA